MEQKTMAGYTDTSKGIIKHARINGIDCPVRVKINGWARRPTPVHRNGQWVYVWPGGGDATTV